MQVRFSIREAAMANAFLPADTSAEAIRVQHAVHRRMSPETRLRLACQMSDSIRAVAADGVRARHPEYTERQNQLAVIRMTLGNELFRRVYPGQDVAP
jgi:hypothetical protein